MAFLRLKTGSVLVLLAVVLAVLGAGLSYTGYNESQNVVTVKNTQSYTSTFTNIVPSRRTETTVVTTVSTLSILDKDIDITGIKDTRYCAYYHWTSLTLDAGKVNVSYYTDGKRVDFWMFTEDQWTAYSARRSVCEDISQSSKVSKPHSVSYEFTTNIPISATYYFVFVNKNLGSVTINLHVDGGMQTMVLTSTREQVGYSTQRSTLVTRTVSFTSHPAGFGPLFFSGIGLIAVAAIVLAVSRRKGTAMRPAPPSPPSSPGAGKYCINCGAQLRAEAVFCNKCGTNQ